MSSSDDEDDWILQQIQPHPKDHSQKPSHVETPVLSRFLEPSKPSIKVSTSPTSPNRHFSAAPDSPDSDIQIPDIFLMQGEKNRRLLRQNDEIQRQIEAENSKELARADQALQLQSDFLRELNDNGVGYEYTIAHDSCYVQDLVDSYLRKDPELALRRHFYFFSAPKSHEMSSDTDMLAYIGNSRGERKLSCILDSVLVSVHLPHLIKVHGAVLNNDFGKGDLGRSFSEIMRALGGGDPAHNQLKLAHFNVNLPQLIYRTSIVMLLSLERSSTPEQYSEIAHYFYLASSDFLLNKHQREGLCAVLMGPVLNRYVLGMSSWSSISDMAQEFDEMVGQVRMVTCGPESVSCAGHKEAEMYHNFLENAMRSDLSDLALEFVEKLSLKFMEIDGNRMEWPGLVTRVGTICTPNFDDPDSIHKGVFQMQLAAVFVRRLVYKRNQKEEDGGADDDGGAQVIICRTSLLESKDLLQAAVSNFSYVQSDQKVQISRSLSKTYHILDSITRVLDKMAVFLGSDQFYNV